MTALIIDGKAIAKEVRNEVRERASCVQQKLGRPAGFAVVLVGEDPASQVYVRTKSKKASECGIKVLDVHLPHDTSDIVLQEKLRELSQQKEIDGILLQLPLPAHLDEFAALLCIEPAKDVDCLHPYNQGLLMRSAGSFRPCTPAGCIRLIDDARKQMGLSDNLSGLKAVVMGRSILVGRPIGLMLLERHCTVTMCHSRTLEFQVHSREADILIAAVGREKLIQGDAIKPGAVVIDVGINRNDEGKLVGDVDFHGAAEVAGAITPVPGGVGPMTIAMLLSNTVLAAENALT